MRSHVVSRGGAPGDRRVASWSILRAERVRAGTVLLGIAGELDLAAYAPASAVLRGLEHGGCERVVIDLRAVTFIDCTGVRLVTEAHERVRSAGGALLVVAPAPPADRLFTLLGLQDRIRIVRRVPDLD